MSLHLLFAFWSVSILFVITPGIDWAYAITSGVKGNFVLPAVAGLLFGHFLATLIVAAGVGTLIASYPILLFSLTMVGALYVFWIGINLCLHPTSIAQHDTTINPSHLSKSWFVKGICISGLNPKVFLFFLALLPQFIDATSTFPIALQIVLLGMIHILSCGVVYLIVGLSAKKLFSSRPHAMQVISRISGMVMMIIAIILVLEQMDERHLFLHF